MYRYVAVSRERHGSKKWRAYANYTFAGASAMAPLVGVELARAVLSMPCALVKDADQYRLVALLSLDPNRNMFVTPDGRWLGAYVPACFRFYPFAMLPEEGTGKIVLCVDEQSGLVVEAHAAGQEFFDAEGNVAPALRQVVEGLSVMDRSRKVLDLAVNALSEAGVIQPWPITLKMSEGEKPVAGLHRVDEAALQSLPDEAFLRLRAASALALAYAQILSSGQLGIFEHLARLQSQNVPTPPIAALPETLDGLLENLKDDLFRLS